MDDSCVLLIGLNRLFCVQIPNVDELIVARNDVGGSWGEFAVSYPIIVLLERKMEPAIHSRPYFYQFIVST